MSTLGKISKKLGLTDHKWRSAGSLEDQNEVFTRLRTTQYVLLGTLTTLILLGLYGVLLSSPNGLILYTGTPTSISTSSEPITSVGLGLDDSQHGVEMESQKKVSAKTYPCGDTIASARESGCVYDPLTVYWLPSHCSTVYADEFSASATESDTTSGALLIDSPAEPPKWPYYSAISGNSTTDDDEAGGDFLDTVGPRIDLSTAPINSKYYTTHGEHLTHCAYMLIRLSYLVSTGETRHMDRMTGHFEHSKHCAMMLLESAKESKLWNVVDSWGEVRSGDCSEEPVDMQSSY